jgi:hypothetical protein
MMAMLRRLSITGAIRSVQPIQGKPLSIAQRKRQQRRRLAVFPPSAAKDLINTD